jgi:hypothetical protein
MRRLLTTMAVLGLGAVAANAAQAQGPVREGLRRTGEIAIDGTQRAIQGTGQVLQGAAQATRDAGAATLNAAGATARGVGRGVGAITPGVPLQARGDATLTPAEQRRDARWRFARHNNEWWYYSPENNWMYHRNGQWNEFAEDRFQPLPQQGERYSMGYRGVDADARHDQAWGQDGSQFQHRQQMNQQVRTDRWGRQYVCENGRPVYLDHSSASQQSGDHYANKPELAEGPIDYAPPRPAEAGPATASAASESQAELQSRGVPADANVSNPGNYDSAGDGPQAPREINNNPAPSSGTGADTGAAKVQTPQ